MAGTTRFIFVVALAFLATVGYVQCSPAIAPNYDQMGICIENCAQCKKMLGNWFDGQLCADFCIKFKGKIIPDCENLNSIAPFLNNV